MKMRIALIALVAFGIACTKGASSEKEGATGSEASTAKKPFTILATGDVGGEIAPCG